MLSRKDVESISRSLNEPEWLLEERLYAFSIFEEFVAKNNSLADKFNSIYSKASSSRKRSIASSSTGFGVMSFHDLLYNELRAEFAKEAFLSKQHKPESNPEIAFVLAFFTDCNFYFAEAAQKIDFRNEIADGVSVDLFFLEDKCTGNIIRNLKDGLKLEEYNIGASCNLESLIINTASNENVFISCANIIGSYSVVNTYSASFGSGKVETLDKLAGEKAEAYDVELFIEGDNNNFAINSTLQHTAHSTKGNIYVKGITKDSAKVKLDGMIKVDVTGAGAESFLDQHVILMNPGCHAEANPELEIENNDISSRHSASVSQIDDEKIFYTECRGVSKEQAKELIVEGFLNSAVERIKSDKLKEEVVAMMEKYR